MTTAPGAAQFRHICVKHLLGRVQAIAILDLRRVITAIQAESANLAFVEQHAANHVGGALSYAGFWVTA